MQNILQQEYFGLHASDSLPEVVKKHNATNIFLVTSQTLHDHEKIVAFRSFLESTGVSYTEFSDFENNPQLEDIKHGIALYAQESRDMVVAIGGGSVIDVAKGVAVFTVQPEEPLVYITGGKKLSKHSVPLVAVPTTAGTGTEATPFFVVYHEQKKYSVDHEYVLPSVAIVDPVFIKKAPASLIAVAGLDALSQSIESYWAIRSNDVSQRYARESIQLLIAALPKAVEGMSEKLSLDLCQAANLSGKAIAITRTTAAHAVSYPLTSLFDIPHGLAVVITLPSFFKFNYAVDKTSCNDERGVDFVRERIKELCELVGCGSVEKAVTFLKNYICSLPVNYSLTDFGVQKQHINDILSLVSLARLNNNPRAVTEDDIRNIFLDLIE